MLFPAPPLHYVRNFSNLLATWLLAGDLRVCLRLSRTCKEIGPMVLIVRKTTLSLHLLRNVKLNRYIHSTQLHVLTL